MIDFEELVGGFADEEYRDPSVAPVSGLIVAEKARHGDDLVLEAQAFVDSTKGVPFVMFYEGDDTDPNAERWANSDDWRVAMDLIRAPTEQAAIDWTNTRIGERLEQWADRLDEAGL